MKTNLVFATLGVSATLLLGNSPALALTVPSPVTQTVQKEEVKTPEIKEEKVEAPAEPEAPAEIVVTVERGDTLEEIAKEHNTTYVRLFNANPSIASPDAINVGDKVTIPAEDKELEDRFSQLAPPAPVQTSSSSVARQSTGASSGSRSYNTGSAMWCTDYVHSKRPDVPIYGNAGYSWISSARAAGKATGTTPQAGAVAVMAGHVAYVERVNGDGSYVVSEMGWNYQAGNYNIRTVQPGAFGGFIY